MNFKKNMEDTDKAIHDSGMKVIDTQEYMVVSGQERNTLNIRNQRKEKT